MINKSKLNKLLFFFAYLIMSFVTLSSISDIFLISDLTRNILNCVSIALYTLKIVNTKYTFKEILCYGIIIIFCLYSYFSLGLSLFIFLAWTIIAMKNIDIKKIIVFDIWFKILFLLIHFSTFVFVELNIFNLDEIIRVTSNNVRHSIYLRTPNNFLGILFWIIAEINYEVKQQNNKIIVINLALFIFFCFIMYLTYSRTPFIMLIIYYLFNIFKLFFSKKEKYYKIITALSRKLFLLFSILTLLLLIFCSKYGVYSNVITSTIDSILSTRLFLSTNAYNMYGITLLGNDVLLDYNYLNMNFIDSLYPMIFVKYGIIYVLIIVYICLKIPSKNFYKEKLIVILFAIYGLSEHFIFNVGFCPALLILASIFYTMEEKNEKENSRI